MGHGVSRLETKCSELESTVGRLNAQIEKIARSEEDMEARIGRLSRTLNESSSIGKGAREEAERMQRALESAEVEKKVCVFKVFPLSYNFNVTWNMR